MLNGKPLVIDGYCGLGGWSEGFLAEGWECIGIDIERHDYGKGGYPGHLILQDMRTVHGSQFKDADAFVFSPPCQTYSWMAMPWTLAKQKAAWYREDPERQVELNALFNVCFRIQREACEAAGRHIPMVVENVRGAQPWVGPSRWHYGSFHLWGDVPALMPVTRQRKVKIRSWSDFGQEGYRPEGFNVKAAQDYRDGLKLPGNNAARRWEDREVQRLGDAGKKNNGNGSWFDIAEDGRTQQAQWRDGARQPGISGPRDNGKGDKWFQDGAAKHGSKSNSRKAASAQIAKIPFPLARHIACVFKPYT